MADELEESGELKEIPGSEILDKIEKGESAEKRNITSTRPVCFSSEFISSHRIRKLNLLLISYYLNVVGGLR